MKISCEIIKDLLPLYYDGVCSDKSKALVDEHIRECDTCRKYLNALGEDEYVPVNAQTNAAGKTIIKGLKKKVNRRSIVTAAVLLALVLAILGARAVFIVRETPVEYHEGMIEVKLKQCGDKVVSARVYGPERYTRIGGWSCTREIELDGEVVEAVFFYYSDNVWHGWFPDKGDAYTGENAGDWGSGDKLHEFGGDMLLKGAQAIFYLVPEDNFISLLEAEDPTPYLEDAVLIWKAEIF